MTNTIVIELPGHYLNIFVILPAVLKAIIEWRSKFRRRSLPIFVSNRSSLINSNHCHPHEGWNLLSVGFKANSLGCIGVKFVFWSNLTECIPSGAADTLQRVPGRNE